MGPKCVSSARHFLSLSRIQMTIIGAILRRTLMKEKDVGTFPGRSCDRKILLDATLWSETLEVTIRERGVVQFLHVDEAERPSLKYR